MILRLFLILLFEICFFTKVSMASKAYVTDSFRISLRRGPSIENKILEFLPSGMLVDILEENEGWSRVNILEQGYGNFQGWVLSRYLINRLPWEDQTALLKKENAQIKINLDACKINLEETMDKEHNLSQLQIKFIKTIDTLQKDYKTLKKESADYLKFKAEYELSKEQVNKLKKENDRLKASDRKIFFGMGALVLLSGLAIGIIIGKKNRNRNSLSHRIL